MKKCLYVIAVLWCCLAALSCASSGKYHTHYDEGLKQYENKNYDAAIEQFTQAIRYRSKKSPNDPYFERGRAYYDKKEYEKALADFTTSIQLNPNYDVFSSKIYNYLGNCYFKQKKYAQAADNFAAALKGSPKDKVLQQNLSNAADLLKFTEAIRNNPNDDDAYHKRGMVYERLNNYNDAITDYTEAIRINPEGNAGSYINRGMVYYNRRKGNAAIADYTEAIRIDPKSANAYNNRALVYLHIKKDYDKALADLNSAIAIKADYSLAYNNRGRLYQETGEIDLALADYNIAIRLDPKQKLAYNNRGNIYFGREEYDKAFADYQAALKIDAAYQNAKNGLEKANQMLGERALAAGILEGTWSGMFTVPAQYEERTKYRKKSWIIDEVGGYEITESVILPYNETVLISPEHRVVVELVFKDGQCVQSYKSDLKRDSKTDTAAYAVNGTKIIAGDSIFMYNYQLNKLVGAMFGYVVTFHKQK